MKKILLNKQKGYLSSSAPSSKDGVFVSHAKGEGPRGSWNRIRIQLVWTNFGGSEIPISKRRQITEYDSKKGTVTNHCDVEIELVPDVCSKMMELYQEVTGKSRAEAAVALRDAEEKDMDEVDIAIRDLGQIG